LIFWLYKFTISFNYFSRYWGYYENCDGLIFDIVKYYNLFGLNSSAIKFTPNTDGNARGLALSELFTLSTEISKFYYDVVFWLQVPY
jgi:hypothetical protein